MERWCSSRAKLCKQKLISRDWVEEATSVTNNFLDYGDAEQYRKRVEEVRRDFADLKKS